MVFAGLARQAWRMHIQLSLSSTTASAVGPGHASSEVLAEQSDDSEPDDDESTGSDGKPARDPREEQLRDIQKDGGDSGECAEADLFHEFTSKLGEIRRCCTSPITYR